VPYRRPESWRQAGHRSSEVLGVSRTGVRRCDPLSGGVVCWFDTTPLRLRSQLRAVKTDEREMESIVRLSELSTSDRDLLRDALRVVKQFREVIRHRYHLGLF